MRTLYATVSGVRIFLYGALFMSYLALWGASFGWFGYQYILVPLMVYSVVFVLLGWLQFNFVFCPDKLDAPHLTTTFRLFEMVFLHPVFIVGCIFVLLKCSGIWSISYSVALIPMDLAVVLFGAVHIAKWTGIVVLFCKTCYAGDEITVTDLDELTGLENFLHHHKSECDDAFMKSIASVAIVPCMLVGLILLGLKLDGTYTGTYMMVAAPFITLLCICVLVNVGLLLYCKGWNLPSVFSETCEQSCRCCFDDTLLEYCFVELWVNQDGGRIIY